jgi:urate oxidase / 2-oxo-4-hydroxy-4-carboxy-5-ureidoimidazoline decarboxylase
VEHTVNAEISYGKMQIPLYRTYAAPMSGLKPIPESAFTGRNNIIFAAEVDVEVFGDNFMPAYTAGDNSNVVATDTMKNFVLRKALEFEGSTLEGFLDFLGRHFLATYPQMQSLRVTAKEQPFVAARVPGPHSHTFDGSEVLFSRGHTDCSIAVLDMERDGDSVRITAHRCGRVGLQLIKITGSAFAQFMRDEYTTLPERVDRPLFIYLDVYWKYAGVEQMVAPELSHYIAAEQVRDLVQVVFHEFVSMSIQHLIHEMGLRMLDRFPQMAEVSFEAQNRLWDTGFVSEEDPRLKVYTDPRPPYGQIKLTLSRGE